MNLTDPYAAVKRDVVHSVQKLELLYSKWKQAAAEADFQKHHKKLLESVTMIQGDLNDLDEAIKVVLNNRKKFDNLSDEEIKARQEFITSTQARISKIKEDANNPQHTAKFAKPAATSPSVSQHLSAQDLRRKLPTLPNRGEKASPYAALNEEPDTQEFINQHMRVQRELEQEQDENLDDLAQSVKKLKTTGVEIRQELQVQDKMLDELGEEMDTLQGKMKSAAKQMEKALEEAGQKTKLCCIAVLLAILMVMIFLVFTI